MVEKPTSAEPAESVSNGDVNGETADDGDEWQVRISLHIKRLTLSSLSSLTDDFELIFCFAANWKQKQGQRYTVS